MILLPRSLQGKARRITEDSKDNREMTFVRLILSVYGRKYIDKQPKTIFGRTVNHYNVQLIYKNAIMITVPGPLTSTNVKEEL